MFTKKVLRTVLLMLIAGALFGLLLGPQLPRFGPSIEEVEFINWGGKPKRVIYHSLPHCNEWWDTQCKLT